MSVVLWTERIWCLYKFSHAPLLSNPIKAKFACILIKKKVPVKYWGQYNSLCIHSWNVWLYVYVRNCYCDLRQDGVRKEIDQLDFLNKHFSVFSFISQFSSSRPHGIVFPNDPFGLKIYTRIKLEPNGCVQWNKDIGVDQVDTFSYPLPKITVT